MAPSRSASHAGSWYESDGAVLRGQLEAFLRAATVSAPQPARALIVPYARPLAPQLSADVAASRTGPPWPAGKRPGPSALARACAQARRLQLLRRRRRLGLQVHPASRNVRALAAVPCRPPRACQCGVGRLVGVAQPRLAAVVAAVSRLHDAFPRLRRTQQALLRPGPVAPLVHAQVRAVNRGGVRDAARPASTRPAGCARPGGRSPTTPIHLEAGRLASMLASRARREEPPPRGAPPTHVRSVRGAARQRALCRHAAGRGRGRALDRDAPAVHPRRVWQRRRAAGACTRGRFDARGGAAVRCAAARRSKNTCHCRLSPRSRCCKRQSTNDAFCRTQAGRVLAGYLDDPENLFVVSSDFCHWRALTDRIHLHDAAMHVAA